MFFSASSTEKKNSADYSSAPENSSTKGTDEKASDSRTEGIFIGHEGVDGGDKIHLGKDG